MCFGFTKGRNALALLLLVFAAGVPTRTASRSLAHSDMASYLNKNDVEIKNVASHLAALLEKYDLTTRALARMLLGSDNPAEPLDSDHMPDYWQAEVVTPIQQGVNGQLVQAVLYSNEFRNTENPQRVLVFAGVQSYGRDKGAIPDGACLEATYGSKGTQAESTWHMACLQNGYKAPNMTEWAIQAGALIESTKATFLTGHKQGCDIAKSEGLLKPHLPVVCWSATGSLTRAWIDAYPGLAEAVHGKKSQNNLFEDVEDVDSAHSVFDHPDPEEDRDTVVIDHPSMDEKIDTMGIENGVPATSHTVFDHPNPDENSDTVMIENDIPATNQNFNTDLRSSWHPENHEIFVMQTFTDPSSNCLLPPEEPGTGLAHVCVYPSGSRCDPINGAPRFDYSMFSLCSDMASLPILLESNLPAIFDDESCISREDVGSDQHLRDCPFHNENYDIPYEDPTITWGVDWTEDYSMATHSWSWMISMTLSLLVTAQLFLR